MMRSIANPQKSSALHTSHLASPATHRVCAECQCGGNSLPLYPMNGRQYCEPCLQAWSLSLPAIQTDLHTWSLSEQQEEVDQENTGGTHADTASQSL